MISSFKDLIVWQKSVELVDLTYDLLKEFPNDEKFGIVSQIKRCSVSIPSNIAEGYDRKSRKEYIQFLYIALGSASELETQLYISEGRKFGNTKSYKKINDLLIEVKKMLFSLIRKLK